MAHGSRREEANEEIRLIVKEIKKRNPEGYYQAAFMSYGIPDIHSAVENLVLRGINRVIIMPMFLVTGNHITQDIPELVAKEQERFPQVEFLITRHFASHPALVDIIMDRLNNKDDLKRIGQ